MDQHRHGHDGAAAGCCGCGSKTSDIRTASTETDPACGMKVDPATSKHRADHAGKTYHVCSAGCRTKFEADPAKYLAPQAEAPIPGPAAVSL
jgi:Cu+-exporting ATPase